MKKLIAHIVWGLHLGFGHVFSYYECGRQASIRYTGFALPGDCDTCEWCLQIINPLTITAE